VAARAGEAVEAVAAVDDAVLSVIKVTVGAAPVGALALPQAAPWLSCYCICSIWCYQSSDSDGLPQPFVSPWCNN
jgi:hypothetical protein